MDHNFVATLKDLQASVERAFGKIKSNLGKFSSKDYSQQVTSMQSLRIEQQGAKTNINLMKMEVENLNEENNKTAWQETISKLQSQLDSYKKEISEKGQSMKTDTLGEEDIKVDLKGITVQQAFDRGDKILQQDQDAISRIKKVVNEDVDTMKQVNVELNAQSDKLDVVDEDLKEIDYSLKRAGEQIKAMFKIYATDKLIICMIVVIILLIISIIVVAAVNGKPSSSGATDHFNKTLSTNTTLASL